MNSGFTIDVKCWEVYQCSSVVPGELFFITYTFQENLQQTCALTNFYYSSNNLSMDEAKILIAALNCKDPPLQQELIRSLANYATFQCNQELFCRAGLNVYLPQIYLCSSQSLKKELCILIGNMSLHEQSSQGTVTSMLYSFLWLMKFYFIRALSDCDSLVPRHAKRSCGLSVADKSVKGVG